MVRVKSGVVTHRRHKKILKQTKGYRLLGSRIFKQAKQKVMLAGQHSYRDRRNKKRVFRRLWITRLNAAVRGLGWKYSEFSDALNKKSVTINRKTLSELAITEPEAFKAVVGFVKK